MPSLQPKTCLFDAFGTLFQLNIPLSAVDQASNGQSTQLLNIWRRKQLEYTWLRSLMGQYINFEKITEEALRFAMAELALENDVLFDLLMPIYRRPICFPSVRPMLEQIKKAGLQTAILSNGTRAMLEAGVEYSQIEKEMDHILSVDEIAIFKPSPKVYQLALDRLKLNRKEILFISSNRWDVAGAGHFGLPTVWINRNGQRPEQLPPPADYVLSSLAGLPVLLGLTP